jgi:hypothetical protein
VIQKVTEAGLSPQVTIPFWSPMVIITYTPIVKLLEQIHVVTKVRGIAIFNVLAYLDVVRSGELWANIPGNTTYPSQSPILVSTSNPQDSNSGGTLAAIAYAAQHSDKPVGALKPDDPYLKVIRQCFTEQGNMDTHTPYLISQFLTSGMDDTPMAMIYESDYIFTKLSGEAGPQVTVMYPDPDVISDNTLVSWSPSGEKLTNLLTTLPMTHFEEEHGYRTPIDSNDFMKYMATKGITVPSVNSYNPGLQFVPLPTAPNLQALINATFPG